MVIDDLHDQYYDILSVRYGYGEQPRTSPVRVSVVCFRCRDLQHNWVTTRSVKVSGGNGRLTGWSIDFDKLQWRRYLLTKSYGLLTISLTVLWWFQKKQSSTRIKFVRRLEQISRSCFSALLRPPKALAKINTLHQSKACSTAWILTREQTNWRPRAFQSDSRHPSTSHSQLDGACWLEIPLHLCGQ